MIRENAIDAMNRISENIMISKLVYRSKMKKKKLRENNKIYNF